MKKAAEEFGVEVIDMGDEKGFGQRFHTLSFSESIRRNLLTDYRVVIVCVDDERIQEWIEKRFLVETDTGLSTDARSLAGQIGLLKAIRDWNLHRIISFHGRVKRARDFSEDIIQVTEWLSHDHKPEWNLWADYVSGEMPTISRKQKLKRLRNIGNAEIGLLSNARCLSEGVDVPALDGVAFIDPKGSEIDIIQSVGRAIRLSENKTVGTIVIPVFIEQKQDAQAALEASEYKPIWDVLEALKSHDDRLSNELDQLRIELGAKRKRSVNTSDLTKIFFDLPTSVNESFAQALRTHLVIQTTESWMFWCGLLEEFVAKHGHCQFAANHVTDDGYRLGSWVSHQRARPPLDTDRRERLEALPGWSWDVLSDWWEAGFSHLKEYSEREGHCRVPKSYKSADSYKLGRWVEVQKKSRAEMDADRRQRLESLPGWSWDARTDRWETGFSHLKQFSEREGHCRVPNTYKTDDGFRLGKWVGNQRSTRDELDADRRQRLEALRGWSWNVWSEKWEQGFSYLQEFCKQKKHCRVSSSYRTDDGFKLGQWISIQRSTRDELDADRRKRLEALPGWSWDAIDDRWEEGFSNLKAYSEREGHCRVPKGYKTDTGYPLGNWVGTQRLATKDSARRQRLESLPGWTWEPYSDQWEKGFSYLKEYSEREGHCRVPYSYKINGGYRLGGWLHNQRANKDKMDSDRRKRLEALPGWTWKIENKIIIGNKRNADP